MRIGYWIMDTDKDEKERHKVGGSIPWDVRVLENVETL